MLLQTPSGTDWIIGVGLMFVLAFLMTYLTYKDLTAFFLYLTIFNGFMVWGNMLPLWTLVVNILVTTVILYFQFKSQGVTQA